MIVSILIGYLLGAPLAFLIARRLLAALAMKYGRDESSRRFIRNSGTVLGAIALAPAVFAGVLISGYLTRHDSATGSATGLAFADAWLGLALGLGVIAVVAAAAAAGALLGALAVRATPVGRSH
jgi:hypothetical protein